MHGLQAGPRRDLGTPGEISMATMDKSWATSYGFWLWLLYDSTENERNP
jgi:hypothetical protein